MVFLGNQFIYVYNLLFLSCCGPLKSNHGFDHSCVAQWCGARHQHDPSKHHDRGTLEDREKGVYHVYCIYMLCMVYIYMKHEDIWGWSTRGTLVRHEA